MLTNRERMLLDALSPKAAEHGVEIITVEIVGSKKSPTIRVYVDKEGGVGFDVLTGAQAWIDGVLDEVDPFPGAYMLEVSSPGIDRPLRTEEHFARFVGERAVVRTAAPIDGRSTWTGRIAAVADGVVEIDADGVRASIPIADMKRANLKGAIDFRS